MYTDKVMDHFNNPRNMGEVPNPDGEGTVGNPRCGDIMKITLRIEDDRVADIRFKTFGCAAAVATSSIATELCMGRTVAEVLSITNRKVVEALEGLPPAKLHCSVLAEEAIKTALADYYRKQGIDPATVEGLNLPEEERS